MDTTSHSRRIRPQGRASPRAINWGLIWGDGAVARSRENTGTEAGGRNEFAGIRAGTFESGLSMVSIVDVCPAKCVDEIEEDLAGRPMVGGAAVWERPKASGQDPR